MMLARGQNCLSGKSRFFLVGWLTILLMMSAGCESCNGPNHAKPPEPLTSVSGANLVFLESCPVTDAEPRALSAAAASIAGAIGLQLLETGVSSVASAIAKAAGKDNETITVPASEDSYLYQQLGLAENGGDAEQNPATRCVVFFIAKHNLGDNGDPIWQFPANYGFKPQNIEKWVKLNIVEEPSFYLEAEMNIESPNKMFQIKPKFVWYNKKLKGTWGDKARDLAVTFALIPLSGDNPQEVTGSFTLKDVPVGSYIKLTGEHNDLETGFIAPLPLDSIFNAKVAYRRGVVATEGATGDPILGTPFRMTVSVTETRDVNQWLVAFADAIEQNKKEIAGAIGESVIPSLKESAELDADKAAINANAAFMAAKLEAQIAEADVEGKCKDPGTTECLTAKKALIEKQAAANLKALEAGHTVPYPALLE